MAASVSYRPPAAWRCSRPAPRSRPGRRAASHAYLFSPASAGTSSVRTGLPSGPVIAIVTSRQASPSRETGTPGPSSFGTASAPVAVELVVAPRPPRAGCAPRRTAKTAHHRSAAPASIPRRHATWTDPQPRVRTVPTTRLFSRGWIHQVPRRRQAACSRGAAASGRRRRAREHAGVRSHETDVAGPSCPRRSVTLTGCRGQAPCDARPRAP